MIELLNIQAGLVFLISSGIIHGSSFLAMFSDEYLKIDILVGLLEAKSNLAAP